MTPSALLRDPAAAVKRAPAPFGDGQRRAAYVQCTAETAECTCPEFCERDHDND